MQTYMHQTPYAIHVHVSSLTPLQQIWKIVAVWLGYFYGQVVLLCEYKSLTRRELFSKFSNVYSWKVVSLCFV